MRKILDRVYRWFVPAEDPQKVKREFGMPETLNLTIEITPDGWFVVTSADLPGLVTQAQNHEELIEMVNDAVLTYFDVPRRNADIVYDQFKIGDQLVTYKGVLQTQKA